MSAFANFAETELMKWLFTAAAVSRPGAWYVALHTADPGENGTVGELVGNGYARQSATFDAVVNGATQNSALITFGPCTTANWGDVTHVSVWDAPSGGNCLIKGELTLAKNITVGDSFTFQVGQLDLAAD